MQISWPGSDGDARMDLYCRRSFPLQGTCEYRLVQLMKCGINPSKTIFVFQKIWFSYLLSLLKKTNQTISPQKQKNPNPKTPSRAVHGLCVSQLNGLVWLSDRKLAHPGSFWATGKEYDETTVSFGDDFFMLQEKLQVVQTGLVCLPCSFRNKMDLFWFL